MMKEGTNKDLNAFLSFPDQVTPLTLKKKLRITLDSKPVKFKNTVSRLSKMLGVPIKSVKCRMV